MHFLRLPSALFSPANPGPIRVIGHKCPLKTWRPESAPNHYPSRFLFLALASGQTTVVRSARVAHVCGAADRGQELLMVANVVAFVVGQRGEHQAYGSRAETRDLSPDQARQV